MYTQHEVIHNLREEKKRLAGELLIADGKLEALKTHMESAPDRVPRDNWLRPTKSFLLQVLDWIIAHRKILEAEN